jgi:hypothetical protein
LDIFQEGLITKIMVVPDEISIEQRAPKTAEQIAKDREEFRKANVEFEKANLKKGEAPLEGSRPNVQLLEKLASYTITNLEPKDLKAGDKLIVHTKADIRKVNSFDADSVQFILSPVLAAEDLGNPNEDSATDLVEKKSLDMAPVSNLPIENIN